MLVLYRLVIYLMSLKINYYRFEYKKLVCKMIREMYLILIRIYVVKLKLLCLLCFGVCFLLLLSCIWCSVFFFYKNIVFVIKNVFCSIFL